MTRFGGHAVRLAAIPCALLLLLSAPSAARADDPCASAWVAVGDDDGIGGTGFGDDDGIGGTGFGDDDGIGGTGVLGTITGFASICVNGLEVHYGSGVPVTRNGSPATVDDLSVGQVVWIVTSSSEGRFVADSIAVLSALSGRVESVDPRSRLLEVGGETVEVPADAVILGRRGGPLSLDEGAMVEISGLRRPDGRVVASRIDHARPGLRHSTDLGVVSLLREAARPRRLSVEGYLRAEPEGQRFRLGDLEIDASALPRDPRPEPRARVWVSGELRGSTLRAERIVLRPERPEAPRGVPRPSQQPPETPVMPDKPDRPPEPVPLPPERPDILVPDRIDRPEIPERPTLPDRPDLPVIDRSLRP
jgi:hypothetical protein